MAEYTHGRWMYSGGYPAFVAVASRDEDEPGNALKAMVCALDNPLESYHRPSNEVDANGWLIASAPDLYEAAVYLLGHENPSPDSGLNAESYAEAWDLLKEAVAKAEGEEGV